MKTRTEMVKRKRGGKKFANLDLHLMIAPAVIYFIIFAYLPLFGLIIAFKNYNYTDGILFSPWCGLDNFKFLFESGNAWMLTRNTILYNIVFLVTSIALEVILAIFLSEIAGKKLKKICQSIMILPNFISWVVIAVFAYSFLNFETGVINRILMNLGHDPIQFYAEVGAWKYILVFVNLWKDAFINGTSAATVSNMKNFADLYATVNKDHPEWKVEWCPLEYSKNYPTLLSSNGAGVAVSNSSKNPDRALMLLELLNTDERYFNLTTYGIEGKNYVINADGMLELPEGVTADNNGFPADGAGNYGWRNNKYMKSFVREWKDYDTYEAAIMENTKWNPYNGFAFDSTQIQNQITAISSVTEQYLRPLYWGTIEPEAGLKEMREKLKAAGFDEVFEEVTRQAKEYLKNRTGATE